MAKKDEQTQEKLVSLTESQSNLEKMKFDVQSKKSVKSAQSSEFDLTSAIEINIKDNLKSTSQRTAFDMKPKLNLIKEESSQESNGSKGGKG